LKSETANNEIKNDSILIPQFILKMNSRGIYMNKIIIALFLISLTASAQDRGPRGHHHDRPDLTDEQKKCLQNSLGEPGKGQRPDHAKMEAALKSCGVETPKKPQHDQEAQQETQPAAQTENQAQ
jgi:hypothetical protein